MGRKNLLKKCEICGKEFTTTTNKKKYCTKECAKKAIKEYNKKYYKENPQKGNSEYKEKGKGYFVYFIINKKNKRTIYIGSTTNIYNRYNNHRSIGIIKEAERMGAELEFGFRKIPEELINKYGNNIHKDIERYMLNRFYTFFNDVKPKRLSKKFKDKIEKVYKEEFIKYPILNVTGIGIKEAIEESFKI